MMGDPLGSSRVSSQKQNREGVVGAQSRQYRATVESNPGCGGGLGRDVTILLENISILFCNPFDRSLWHAHSDIQLGIRAEPIPGRMCADEDVGALREVDCNIPHCPGKWIMSSLVSGSIGTSKLSEFTREQSHDG
ncbi:unnamed protein product [Malus baccata var. baccata]